jgi:hypothetical protein
MFPMQKLLLEYLHFIHGFYQIENLSASINVFFQFPICLHYFAILFSCLYLVPKIPLFDLVLVKVLVQDLHQNIDIVLFAEQFLPERVYRVKLLFWGRIVKLVATKSFQIDRAILCYRNFFKEFFVLFFVATVISDLLLLFHIAD